MTDGAKQPRRARSKSDKLRSALAVLKTASKQLDNAIEAVAQAIEEHDPREAKDAVADASPRHRRRKLPGVESRDWLTTDEVAEQLLVGRDCVVKWARQGRTVDRGGKPVRVMLSALPVGGRLRITKSDLKHFLDSIRTGGESAPTESPAELRRRGIDAQRRAEEALAN